MIGSAFQLLFAEIIIASYVVLIPGKIKLKYVSRSHLIIKMKILMYGNPYWTAIHRMRTLMYGNPYWTTIEIEKSKN